MQHPFLRAALLYAVVIVTGMFSLAYVPQTLIHLQAPEKTFQLLQSQEFLFRLSIGSSALCYLAFLFLVLQLYAIFAEQNRNLSRVMLVLALISVPMSVLNLQHKFAVLELLQNKTLATSSLASAVMDQVKLYNSGLKTITLFWGLWLFPFGLLVTRSRHFPSLLGWLLMGGCVAYLFNFFGSTLCAQYAELGISTYLGFLPGVAEISTCLFLFFASFRNRIP